MAVLKGGIRIGWACMHACMHTYIHTHTHTYIHAHIHTYVPIGKAAMGILGGAGIYCCTQLLLRCPRFGAACVGKAEQAFLQ